MALSKVSGNEVAAAWMPSHFDGIDATLRSLEKMRAAAEPVQVQALVTFATRAYRRPLTQAERDGVVAYYQTAPDEGGLSHEDAMRDSVASILVVSGLPLSRRPRESGCARAGVGVVPGRRPADGIRRWRAG